MVEQLCAGTHHSHCKKGHSSPTRTNTDSNATAHWKHITLGICRCRARTLTAYYDDG